MRIVWLILCGLAVSASVKLDGCLNEMVPEVRLDGSYRMVEEDAGGRIGNLRSHALDEGARSVWVAKLREREYALKSAPTNIALRNDYGVALAHVGRADEAVKIWRAIEEEQPGLYQVAANLGTGYELTGNNEEAMRWIDEGIRRNPNDHQGTEWLHHSILYAKIALTHNPHWLDNHHVLPVDFGDGERPLHIEYHSLPEVANSKVVEISEFRSAIEYQLGERLQFVRAPDPVVADLFFDLGNIYAQQTNLTDALEAYDAALQFGFPETPTIKAREAYFKKLIRRAEWKEKIKYFFLIAGVVLIFLLLFIAGPWWVIRGLWRWGK